MNYFEEKLRGLAQEYYDVHLRHGALSKQEAYIESKLRETNDLFYAYEQYVRERDQAAKMMDLVERVARDGPKELCEMVAADSTYAAQRTKAIRDNIAHIEDLL